MTAGPRWPSTTRTREGEIVSTRSTQRRAFPRPFSPSTLKRSRAPCRLPPRAAPTFLHVAPSSSTISAAPFRLAPVSCAGSVPASRWRNAGVLARASAEGGPSGALCFVAMTRTVTSVPGLAPMMWYVREPRTLRSRQPSPGPFHCTL